MRRIVKLAFVALVLLLGREMLPPAFAGLQDYGIYVGAIRGSSAMRLEDSLRKTEDTKTKSNKWLSRTNLKTRGFIWDPRFLKFEGGLSYLSSKSETDTTDMGNDSMGFNLTAVLFPRWRYPYRPINLFANKSTSTADMNDLQVDTTSFGVHWGLGHKMMGRVRMSYDGKLSETTGDQMEQDEMRHRLKVDARRTFLKEKWGESRVNYGYAFDYSEDKVGEMGSNTSFLQNFLYASTFTRFGEKMEMSATANFSQSTNDSGDSGGSRGRRD